MVLDNYIVDSSDSDNYMEVNDGCHCIYFVVSNLRIFIRMEVKNEVEVKHPIETLIVMKEKVVHIEHN